MIEPQPGLSAHDALLDAAADVALNLRAHQSYRASHRRALAALKGRRPGFSPDQYKSALDAAIVLFDTGRILVDEHCELLGPKGQAQTSEPAPLVRMLAERCPGFPRVTYESLLNWIHIYYHEM